MIGKKLPYESLMEARMLIMMSFEVIVSRKWLDKIRAWRQKVLQRCLTNDRTWQSRGGLDALALMSQSG